MPLIVGGGPAGSAAAIGLARAGHRPVLVERTTQPADMLCGGFLSWNTASLLARCGVDPVALGGHVILRARIFAGGHQAELPLPAPATGLSRKRLDQALLDSAAQAGATIRRGVTVRAIEGGSVRLGDGTVERPDSLILATGKRDVRGAARADAGKGKRINMSMGLRWRFPASPRLAAMLGDAIELHLFDHGYAGLMLQEDGAANLCMAVRLTAFGTAGSAPDAMLAQLLATCPALADRLAHEDMGAAQAVANVPYGWRAQGGAADLYRVGDQIGVIPSIAGEGVGIALMTGLAAADALAQGQTPDSYQGQTSRHVARPIGVAMRLWAAAEHPAIMTMALPLLTRFPGVAGGMMRWTRV